MTMLRYTATVRRGFTTLVNTLIDQSALAPDNPAHPLLVNLKGARRTDAISAIRWMVQEANAQYDRDGAKKGATECPDSPPPATNSAAPTAPDPSPATPTHSEPPTA